MVYGCGSKVVRGLVFLFNFLAFLAGLILLIACIVTYYVNPIQKYVIDYIDHIDSFDGFNATLIVGMVLGGVILLLGFCGCCGAWKESQCLLTTLSIVMLLLIAVQVVVGSLVYVYQDKIEDGLKVAFNETAKTASNDGNSSACKMYQDFSNNTALDHCCGNDGYGLGSGSKCILGCEQGNNPGCVDEIWKLLESAGKVASIVVISVVVLEILSMLFSCCLCCAVRRGENLYEEFA